jgi:uncharacterized peroxidase-related enzyme
LAHGTVTTGRHPDKEQDMTRFAPHSPDTAPEEAREILSQIANKYGFLPNLMATMAESPELVKAYAAIGDLFARTGFTSAEQQVVLLAISRLNGCDYCVAAHSTVAGMQQVPADVVAAIRDDQPLKDPRLEALRRFATAVVEQRGWVSEEQVEEFLAAGYEQRRVFDIILGAAMKTLSNYTNHVAATPLDAAFSEQRWSAPASDAA